MIMAVLEFDLLAESFRLANIYFKFD